MLWVTLLVCFRAVAEGSAVSAFTVFVLVFKGLRALVSLSLSSLAIEDVNHELASLNLPDDSEYHSK
jgi:hypothetical protein